MEKLFKLHRSEKDAVPAVLKSALYATDGPTGLQCLAEPAKPVVDIVFVHGLTGNRENTWTHQNKLFWPRDLLTRDIPDARIMTFGYDADVVKIWGMNAAGSNGLHGHGKSLAYAISDSRFENTAKTRPIILVSHSLGGLVCEQALLVCRAANEDRLKSVLQSIVGIIFLGTPHKGSDLAAWGSTLAKYLHRIRSVNRNIVKTLQGKSEVLSRVEQDFQQLMLTPEHVNRTRIFCFYEELVIPVVGKIVQDESAILEQYSNLSIHANHMDMTRFSGDTDDGYRAVCGVLKDWVNDLKKALSGNVNDVQRLNPALTLSSVRDGYARDDAETGMLLQNLQPHEDMLQEGELSELECRHDIDHNYAVEESGKVGKGVRVGGTTVNSSMSTSGGPLILDSIVSGNTFHWGS